MRLYCKSCGEQLQSEDLDVDQAQAKCRACDAVFSIAEDLEWHRKREKAAIASQEVPLPPGMKLEQASWGPRFVLRWFARRYVFGFLFSLIWNGMLFWMFRSIAQQPDVPLASYLVPVVHVAAGIGLFYWSLAGLVNRTTLGFQSHELRLRSGPLPWRGNLTFSEEDIEQLFCTGKSHSAPRPRPRAGTKARSGSAPRRKVAFRLYAVWLLAKDGWGYKLISRLERAEQALFIERQLEEHLGIADRIVPGEIKPSVEL